MALARSQQVAPRARWSCPRCYTVNAFASQFCSDCGLAPRASRAVAMPTPAMATRRRLAEIVPFLLFAVIAIALLGLQLAH
jgi:membrane protease subunit (stomatin/prohibitin family)